MIVILDYGMGNVGSIQNMIRKIGYREVLISNKPDEICRADKLILPGVGAFDAGVNNLRQRGLIDLIREQAEKYQKAILGICLGMQLLGTASEEGALPGLGLIPFECKRFRFEENSMYKVPHMGWFRTTTCAETPLTFGLEPKERFYYVHSYHAVCEHNENVLMTCEYGKTFPAAVFQGRVYGVQFHPEKSHLYGMKVLKNFVERC